VEEDYQLEFLRGFLDVAAERPFMFGMHVWNFADFKTGQGTMRAAAMNFKGVFYPRPAAQDGGAFPALALG
jgi:beta-glucuronidase